MGLESTTIQKKKKTKIRQDNSKKAKNAMF